MQSSEQTRNGELAWLKIVHEQIATIRFGIVQIVVHEGKVVQVEKTEKVRLTTDDKRS